MRLYSIKYFLRKMMALKNNQNRTRVEVSDRFSADQLWFRILSGLFRRCSLPENLWTALIQLWTALKTEIFRAKNQRCCSSVSLWNSADSELNSADFLWNSAEQRWFLNNSEWQFLVNFSFFFKIFLTTSISRHIILVFTPVYEKKWATKIYFSIFVQNKDITHTHTWIFGFIVTSQVTNQIWFTFSKTFLRL